MSDIERVSALKGHRIDGEFGASVAVPGVTLGVLAPMAIAQVNGAPAEDVLQTRFTFEQPLQARRVAQNDSCSLIWNGPGKWFAVSQSESPREFVASLRVKLDHTDATVTDLSHARTVIRISGQHAADVLCKGCPGDIEAMQTGACMATLMGSIAALVHCCETQQSFDIYVFRSFGQAFWEWLTDAALEYGYCLA